MRWYYCCGGKTSWSVRYFCSVWFGDGLDVLIVSFGGRLSGTTPNCWPCPSRCLHDFPSLRVHSVQVLKQNIYYHRPNSACIPKCTDQVYRQFTMMGSSWHGLSSIESRLQALERTPMVHYTPDRVRMCLQHWWLISGNGREWPLWSFTISVAHRP